MQKALEPACSAATAVAEEADERYRLVVGKAADGAGRRAGEEGGGQPGHRAALGESGSGKEIFARAIHVWSERRHEPFIAIMRRSVRELLESELFGHEKGALPEPG